MLKKFKKLSPLMLILLVSCSGIQTKNKYRYTKLNKSPTTTIKKFTDETQQRKLDEVVSTGVVKISQDKLFLRAGEKNL